MLSNFFVIAGFITKCDKKTSPTLFGPYRKNLLQSVTNGECFTNFNIIITNCDKKLLQQVLPSVAVITKWDVKKDYTAQRMTFSIKDSFIEESLNGELHFLCCVIRNRNPMSGFRIINLSWQNYHELKSN